MSNNESDDEYASYNGMNRPALLMGIPLMPLLFGGFLMVFGGFLGLMTIGGYGLIFPSIVGLILFVIRLICEDDPNAMKIISWRLKGFCLRLGQKNDVLIFISSDEKRKVSHAKRFFKKASSYGKAYTSVSV
ncbi:VirB3 family type IV secretion system protein [Salmonella enterica]